MVVWRKRETLSFAQKVVVLLLLGESTALWRCGYEVQRSQGILLNCRLS